MPVGKLYIWQESGDVRKITWHPKLSDNGVPKNLQADCRSTGLSYRPAVLSGAGHRLTLYAHDLIAGNEADESCMASRSCVAYYKIAARCGRNDHT